MATSGTYSFTVTRDDIIRDAMLNLGHLGEGEGPTPQETVDCARKLNMMVKQWMGKADYAPGLKTWTRRQGYAFLSGTTGQYQIGPNNGKWTNSFVQTLASAGSALGTNILYVNSVAGMTVGDNIGVQINQTNSDPQTLFWSTVQSINSTLNQITLTTMLPVSVPVGAVVYDYTTNAQIPVAIETAVLRDSSNEDTILRLMNIEDYQSLPSKTDPTNISDPTAIYVERQLNYSYVFTDCAAANDVTKYLVIEYMEPIQDFNNPLDTPEYPQEWYLALTWGLTRQIAPMFGVNWTQTMQANLTEAVAIARNLNPDTTSIYFQPGLE
jgi:hypothetical protein